MISVAIDGPAGAGKSSISKEVARRMNFLYIDTGAMYRAVGYYCIKNNIDYNDEEKVNSILDDLNIVEEYTDKTNVYLNGEDITGLIRTESVSKAASVTSSYKNVRVKLVELQREMAKTMNVIMDGRDIGSVVLPNAELKIYLDASPEIRAERRLLELSEDANYEDVLRDIKERDDRDMNRKESPLVQVEDAIYIDNGICTQEETIEKIMNLIKEKEKSL